MGLSVGRATSAHPGAFLENVWVWIGLDYTTKEAHTRGSRGVGRPVISAYKLIVSENIPEKVGVGWALQPGPKGPFLNFSSQKPLKHLTSPRPGVGSAAL